MRGYRLSVLAGMLLLCGMSSQAAEVSLYGSIDTGLNYVHRDNGTETTDDFSMRGSNNTMNRFGVRGEEKINDDLTVGFILENGYLSDSGQQTTANKFFDRESALYVDSSFGRLTMGRLGELTSGNGSVGLFGAAIAPFSTGWGEAIPGHAYVMSGNFGRLDNTIVYKTPSIYGFNVHLQYSGSTNSAGLENKSSSERYLAGAVTYQQGPLYVAAILDQRKLSSLPSETRTEDPLRFSAGFTYDFDVAKLFVSGQYFRDSQISVSSLNPTGFSSVQADGFGLNVGVSVNALAGIVRADVGYMDAEDAENSSEAMSRYIAALGYEYPLSKVTAFYTGVGYYQDTYDNNAPDGKSFSAVVGLYTWF